MFTLSPQHWCNSSRLQDFTPAKLLQVARFTFIVVVDSYQPLYRVTMGRMHAPGKGICASPHLTAFFSSTNQLPCDPASSALPYRRAPPSWLKTTPEDVVDHIVKLARKGLTPSQIGVTLRDSHGIPQVRFVTGNKILRILKSQGAPFLSFFSSPTPSSYLFFFLFLLSSFAHCKNLHTPFVWG